MRTPKATLGPIRMPNPVRAGSWEERVCVPEILRLKGWMLEQRGTLD